MGLPSSSSLFFEEKKFVKLISRKIVHQSMNNIIKIFMVSDYNQTTTPMRTTPIHLLPVTWFFLQITLLYSVYKYFCVFLKKWSSKKLMQDFLNWKKVTPDKKSQNAYHWIIEKFFSCIYIPSWTLICLYMNI